MLLTALTLEMLRSLTHKHAYVVFIHDFFYCSSRKDMNQNPTNVENSHLKLQAPFANQTDLKYRFAVCITSVLPEYDLIY